VPAAVASAGFPVTSDAEGVDGVGREIGVMPLDPALVPSVLPVPPVLLEGLDREAAIESIAWLSCVRKLFAKAAASLALTPDFTSASVA
jgi:hypothetical protein